MFDHLLEKYRSNRKSFLLFAGNGLVTLINFCILSFLSHQLPVETYGTYRQLLTFINLAVSIGSLGFAQAIYFQLSKADLSLQQQYDSINANRFLVIAGSIITVLAMLLGQFYFRKEFNNPEFDKLLLYAFGIAFFNVFQSVDVNVSLAIHRYKRCLGASLVMFAFRLAWIVYCRYQHWELESYMRGILLSGVAYSVFIQATLYADQLSKMQFRIDFQLVKEQLQYGLPIGLGVVFGVIMLNTDRIVLMYFIKDVKAFAILANGAFEVPFLSNYYLSFYTLALPLMIRAYEQQDWKAFFKARHDYIRQVAPIIFPAALVFILWSDVIITTIFGAAYAESAAIFSIYTLCFFVRFCSHHDVFTATGKNAQLIWLQSVEVLFNIVLMFFLVGRFGMIGAPIATVITLYLYIAATAYYSEKISGTGFRSLFPLRFLGKVLLLSLIVLLPFYGFKMIAGAMWNSVLGTALQITLFGLLYAGLFVICSRRGFLHDHQEVLG